MATDSGKRVLDTQLYNKHGYVVLRKFFGRDDVDIVLKEAQSVFAVHGDMFELFRDKPLTFANCGKQCQHLINLHKLALQDRVIKLLHEAGLAWPVICTRPVIYFNHPLLAIERVYHTVDAHQDWRSMQGSSNAAVLWCPLVKCDEAIGALQVLPGSHLSGLRTTGIQKGFGMVTLNAEEELQMISLEAEPGDVVLFNSMLIHRSGNNITELPRWSCHFRYNDLDDPAFIERGYVHPYIYKPMEELL